MNNVKGRFRTFRGVHRLQNLPSAPVGSLADLWVAGSSADGWTGTGFLFNRDPTEVGQNPTLRLSRVTGPYGHWLPLLGRATGVLRKAPEASRSICASSTVHGPRSIGDERRRGRRKRVPEGGGMRRGSPKAWLPDELAS